jgi:signal transduction histidine kinase
MFSGKGMQEYTPTVQGAGRFYKFFAQSCGGIVAMIGVIAIVGWVIGSPLLTGIEPYYVPMAPNTAIAFIILGISLYAFVTVEKWGITVSRTGAFLVFVLSVIHFSQLSMHIKLHVNQWFLKTPSTRLGLIPEGKMGLPTAISFLFSSIAILIPSSSGRHGIIGGARRLLIGATVFAGLAFSLGYIYGAPLLYGGITIPMAINTAAAFCVLGIGLYINNISYDIAERKQTIQSLKKSRDELELLVAERTEELLKTNREIKQLNEELEQRVMQRTAQLQAANQELEAFSYSVSHDLRSPLRSIDGFSKALLEDYQNRLDEQGRDFLHRIRTASQHMGDLIDDMLRLSRVTRNEIQYEMVDLGEVAREIASELEHKEPGRNVEFVVQEGLVVNGDRKLLRIMMENLMANAWKFTGKHPEARIEFGTTTQDNEKVYFVRDDGAGFDMAYKNKLFAPFQRLHSHDEFPGTGIGTAIVQRIIRKHGGKVWAIAEVEKGATFYFSLPQNREIS